MNKLYKQIGKNIKKFRISKDMKQEDLAKKIGISPSYLSHIENGNRGLSLDIIIDISKALELSVSDILSGCSNTLENGQLKVIDNYLKTCKDEQQVKMIKNLLDAIVKSIG